MIAHVALTITSRPMADHSELRGSKDGKMTRLAQNLTYHELLLRAAVHSDDIFSQKYDEDVSE